MIEPFLDYFFAQINFERMESLNLVIINLVSIAY
jgi:hypothetical protein